MGLLNSILSIEGIGDEVLYAMAILVLGVICLVFYFNIYRSNIVLVPARPYSNTSTCPICLCSTTLTLETNCGHKFCGRCMMQYWRHLGPFRLSIIKCALCRQPVTMLFSVFSPDEQRASDSSTLGYRRNHLIEEMHNYNRNFSTAPRSYWQMVLDSPVLVRHLLGDLISDTGIMRVFQLRILCCIIGGLFYVLSPLDILPEALFGFVGFIDDVLILLMLFVYLSTIYHRIMLNRAHDLSWMDSENEEEEDEAEVDETAEPPVIDHTGPELLAQQRPTEYHREEIAVHSTVIRRMREHVLSLSPILEQDSTSEQDSVVQQNSLVLQDSEELDQEVANSLGLAPEHNSLVLQDSQGLAQEVAVSQGLAPEVFDTVGVPPEVDDTLGFASEVDEKDLSTPKN